MERASVQPFSPSASTHHTERGVALVITLILLSVITFLAITFLAVARREKGSVAVTTEQKVATLAAESAQERARAEVVAIIVASTNLFNFDLLVSTNFVNWTGFDPNAQPNPSPNPTNVNYFQLRSGAALNANQALQNLANLLYNPRPPVFVTNRLYANSNDFRFYLDLNRNGAYDTNGYWAVISENPALPYYHTNGTLLAEPTPGITLSNHFTCDPEFIGILERPEFPHSPTNKFVARYAFIVLPAGKTLDVNYIGNHAKPNNALAEGYFRNMGVGSWENNFAAFLRDLNTNVWQTYAYRTNLNNSSTGVAFDDAHSFVQYRARAAAPIPVARASVDGMFGTAGANAFRRDFFDGYTAGPLLTDYRGWNYLATVDADGFRTSERWPGAYHPDHFFTSQDFFNRAKVGYAAAAPPVFSFVERLFFAQTNFQSSYDRTTFYRMLAQLGTDSAPDPDEKLNVNYINVGPFKSTNFISWNDGQVRNYYGRPGSEIFFTNAVDRLLKRYTAEWRARSTNDGNQIDEYYQMFGTNGAFGAGNIPVLVNGRFAYTPSVHRVLQLAANIWDATNPSNNPAYGPEPTVFRPVFKTVGRDVFIQDFVEWPIFDPAELSPQPLDLNFSNAVASVRPDSLIFGVPFIIGARKGLPNFNEFSGESTFQISRKVQVTRTGTEITGTNQLFTIGISNAFGAEFWNSYTSNYHRPVEVAVVNFSLASVTNDYGFRTNISLTAAGWIRIPSGSTNFWPAWDPKRATGGSLLVPLRTNHIIIKDSVYRLDRPKELLLLTETFKPVPPVPEDWRFAFPYWGLTVTNRVVAYIRDRNSGRLLDYVQLASMVSYTNLTEALLSDPNPCAGVWAVTPKTNSDGVVRLSGQRGVISQIQITKGDEDEDCWENHSGHPSGATKYQAIANFKAFFNPDRQATFRGYRGFNTNSEAYAFAPTWKASIPVIWQANDPLVHYTAGDMEHLERAGEIRRWIPASGTNLPTLVNLGRVNERYRPWGGNTFVTGAGSSPEADENAYNYVFKDPGVRASDKWEFLTNKLASLGWLGRVHRGSPWQTVYLKAAPSTNAVAWKNWSGNRVVWNTNNATTPISDSQFTVPEADRVIFDVFTTALNENATRGQLPINQTNLAAWSAVFSGMVALTNSSSPEDFAEYIARVEPVLSSYAPFHPGIDPAGVYDPFNTNTHPALVRIVAGINRTRADTNLFRQQTFTRLGDILAVPELTTASPFLNHGFVDDYGPSDERKIGLNDAVMEWLPQQMMSLVRLGEPRFVVYAYGQGLKPAPQAVQASGTYFGMVTNYQITAEVVTRAVVRIEGAPDNPRAVVESYNVLPPD